jgi:protease-4
MMDYNSSSGTSTPPPFNSPPPVISAPPPPRPARRWGWIVVSAILFVLLGFSVLINRGDLFSGFAAVGATHRHAGGPRLDEVFVEDCGSKNKIAVIPIEGVIMGGGSRGGYSLVDLIKAQLERAAEDTHVKAVILKVDSPGGEVLASDEIARHIREFKDNSRKPVIVSMGSLAASGGYYVAAPADWIVANELTITGSIGVIMQGWNYRGLMDKVGLRPNVYKSGKFKDMLSGSRYENEISAEERAMVQNLIDETYGKFKSVVADGRTKAKAANEEVRGLTDNWADYADGRILSGREAHAAGFVDELGSFNTAAARAEKLAGVKDANLIEYRPRVDFADLFSLFGQSEARAVKLDLGVEMPQLEAGRMYFISSTYLH